MQKTPSKSEKNINANSETTPDKSTPTTPENQSNSSTSKDTEELTSLQFSTPKKVKGSTALLNDSPGKSRSFKSSENDVEGSDSKSNQPNPGDGENDMLSTTEQARLLIAAGKTPSKSVNKTPAKKSTPTGKRSIENSPVTPGKFRRVELITISSPKAKRIKQL